jgi:uncharacterized protein YxjI
MLFDQKTYVVKEQVGLLKLTDVYDILDPRTGATIAVAKEEPNPWAKWLRLVVNKSLMPTVVNVYEQGAASPVLSIRRGVAIFRPKVMITGAGGAPLGHFLAKAFSLGGAFRIFDVQGTEVGAVKGDWKGWNFVMSSPSGQELGRVTKKWAGLGKEFFTSADTYVISIADGPAPTKNVAPLLLAAGLAIDTVYKEKS